MSEQRQHLLHEHGGLYDSLMKISHAPSLTALFEQLTCALHRMTHQMPIAIYRHTKTMELRLIHVFPSACSLKAHPRLISIRSVSTLLASELQYYELKCEAETWGYIALPPSYHLVSSRWSRLVITIAAQRLGLLTMEQLAERRAGLKRYRQQLSSDIKRFSDFKDIVRHHGERLCKLFESQGIALLRKHQMHSFGDCPSERHILNALETLTRGNTNDATVELDGMCQGGVVTRLDISCVTPSWLFLFRHTPLSHLPENFSANVDPMGYWSPLEMATMTELADHIAMAITAMDAVYLNQQLTHSNQRLQTLARTDPLTQCWNRHYTEMTLSRLIDSDVSLSVILFDVDDFKNINDTFGHSVGDDVLRRLSQVVQNTLREEDHLGRWGGEEFLIIIRETDTAASLLLAQRLCSIVSTTPFKLPLPVTISIGLTSKKTGDTVRHLVERADHGMYLAKKAGKNRVTIGK
ncbi:GGDEF domain-containing protein [Halomonas sp. CnH100-B]|uniref:GGDEF domain-containing protein n=1 Tax=Halomonas sp. CnH100-B TaxID=2954490 RepID=UPI0020974DC5|nr:GGDEF domain-containing protein [Halomonas sp. CnH100-B]MCO7230426.1 GGDEF domain-containing protein [Halomonas sp. CnH100-B]